jgi:hypothetical protein
MPEQYVPCDTVVGVIAGRDAIYLDTFQYSPDAASITMAGTINGNLCSRNTDRTRWFAYTLVLHGVFAFKMTEIDVGGWRGRSSFDEVVNSSWLADLRARDDTHKLSSRHKHYYIMTYDQVFDTITKSYELSVATEA